MEEAPMRGTNQLRVDQKTEKTSESGIVRPRKQGGLHQFDPAGRQNPSIAWQFVIFTTLAFSIVASRFIDYYRAATPWNPLHDWQYLLFALIVSLLAFPIVYRKARNSRNEPILVQFGVIFAAGLGWEKMLSTAADLVKPIAMNSHF